MDIRKWREEASVSQVQLAQHLGISQSQVSRFEEDPESIPFGLLKRWLARLGVDAARVEAVAEELPPAPVDVGEPYAALNRSLDLVQAYCQRQPQSPAESKDGLPTVGDLSRLVEARRRKPNIVLAGQSDAGKSRLANSLLGRNLLPTRYGPATRLVTNVHHVEDRPSWLNGAEVVLTKRSASLESLASPKTGEDLVRHMGGYDLLQEHAVYKGEDAATGQVDEIFVFADAPLLRAANIVDLPGSRGAVATVDDDARRAAEAASRADVLIYTSTATGFMSGLDLEFLSRFVPTLPPFEKDSSFPVLGNLFIVATHSAPHISGEQLEREILAGGRARLWKHLCESALPQRTAITGRQVERAAFDGRFFAFWAERRELRDPLHAAVGECLGEHLPPVWSQRARGAIEAFRTSAVASHQAQAEAIRRMLDDVDTAQKEHEAFLASEKIMQPLRRRGQRSVEEQFRKVAGVAQQALAKSWTERTTPEAIEKMIGQSYSGSDAKENAKKFAGTRVLELVRNDVFRASARAVASLPKEMEQYFNTGLPHSAGAAVQLPTLEIPADGQGVFAGLAGAGVAALAGLSGGLSLIIGGVLWTLVGDSWQARLAKNLAAELKKSGLEKQFSGALEAYWSARLREFTANAEARERTIARQIQQRGELVQEARRNRGDLEAKREWLEEQRAFFKGVPALSVAKATGR